MNQTKHIRNRRSAFTLLEIMTVVVIIGIVAGMAVMVMNPKDLSDEARRKMTIAKIQDTVSVMTLYEINEGQKAKSWQQLIERGKLTAIPTDAWGKPLELKAGVIRSDAGGSGKPITSDNL